MVVVRDFDGSVGDIPSGLGAQSFGVEFIANNWHIEGGGWERRVNLEGWEGVNLFFGADLSLIVTVDGSNSEDALVIFCEFVVILDQVLRFSIYR